MNSRILKAKQIMGKDVPKTKVKDKKIKKQKPIKPKKKHISKKENIISEQLNETDRLVSFIETNIKNAEITNNIFRSDKITINKDNLTIVFYGITGTSRFYLDNMKIKKEKSKSLFNKHELIINGTFLEEQNDIKYKIREILDAEVDRRYELRKQEERMKIDNEITKSLNKLKGVL